jgi:hypothetical protein
MKWLGIWKMRVTFASSWVSIIGWPLLVADVIQKQIYNYFNYKIDFILLMFLCAVALLTLGYLIDKFKIIESECNAGINRSTDLLKRFEK